MSKVRQFVGIAWYRPGQWQRLREISSDAESLEDTYEEWLTIAEQNVRKANRPNLSIEKVDVDVEELLAWCNERGLEVDGNSRSQYVSELMRQMHESEP